MPTSSATPQYTGGLYERMVTINVSASNDTQSISVAHGISFTDGTATSTIAALLKATTVPFGTQATGVSFPLWALSGVDGTNVTLITYASGASAIGGPANFQLWLDRVHTFQR